MSTKKPIRHATIDEGVDIFKILQKRLTIVSLANEESGLPAIVVYQDGWDDARVAREVNPALGHKSVADRRKRHFGALKSQESATGATDVESLTRLLAELEKKLHEEVARGVERDKKNHDLTVKFNKLVFQVSAFGREDCRHLAIRGPNDEVIGITAPPRAG